MVYGENKFERLIFIAGFDCGNDEVEAFDNLDTSDVVFSNRFQRKKHRIIRKYNIRKEYNVTIKVFLKILISLMIVMSIGFMTIMAVEPLREALFKAVITQYDDHFTISFKPEGEVLVTTQEETSQTEDPTIEASSENAPGYVVDDTTEAESTNEYITTGESTTEEVTTETIKLNDIIKEVRKPTWIPEGMEEIEGINNETLVYYEYYLYGEYYFAYIQQPLNISDILVDNEGATINYVDINGYNGVIALYDEDIRINAFWSDNEYVYQILSEKLSYEEVIMIAQSVIK